MKILAHRGLWHRTEEKNSISALKRALEAGFGVETDIRDDNGYIVISHNIVKGKANGLDELLEYYHDIRCTAPLALNIKADGMQELIREMIERYEIKNYFLFDMSVPEMYLYMKQDFKFFTRYSDIEQEMVLYEEAAGVWADCFEEYLLINDEWISKVLKDKKMIGFISPELHGRDTEGLWQRLKSVNALKTDVMMLCTDRPEEALKYFG